MGFLKTSTMSLAFALASTPVLAELLPPANPRLLFKRLTENCVGPASIFHPSGHHLSLRQDKGLYGTGTFPVFEDADQGQITYCLDKNTLQEHITLHENGKIESNPYRDALQAMEEYEQKTKKPSGWKTRYSYFTGLTDTCTGTTMEFLPHDNSLVIDVRKNSIKGIFPVLMMQGTYPVTICATKDQIIAGIAERQGRFDMYTEEEERGWLNLTLSIANGQFQQLPPEQQTPEARKKMLHDVHRAMEEMNQENRTEFSADLAAQEHAVRALAEYEQRTSKKSGLDLSPASP